MKKLLFGILLLISSSAIGQLNLDWAFKFNGGNCTIAKGLVDPQGNSIVIGWYTPFIDLNPSISSDSIIGQSGSFLAKYDSLGNFIWGFPFECTNGNQVNVNIMVIDMEFDLNGNVVVIGRSSCPIFIDPNSQTEVLNVTNYSGFLASYDSNGNYLWSRRLVEDGGDAYAESIAIDSNNNIYLGGNGGGDFDLSPTSSVWSSGAFLSKYSIDGNLNWLQNLSQISGLNNINDFEDMTFSSNDEIVCASRRDQAPNGNRLVLQRFNAQGSQLYLHEYGNTGSNFTCVLKQDFQNNIIVAFNLIGSFQINYSSGATATVSSGVSTSQYKGVIMKMNDNGLIEWLVEMNQLGNSVFIEESAIDKNGDSYFTGTFGGMVTIVSSNFNNSFSAQGGASAFILKVSNQGLVSWFSQIAETVQTYSYGSRIWVDKFGSIFQAGQFVSSADLDPAATAYILTSSQSISAEQNVCFIRKLNQCSLSYPANTIIYNGDCTNPNATIIAPNADYYSWSNGDTTQTITVNSIGTYSVYLGNSQGCYSQVNEVVIDLNSFTSAEICNLIDDNCNGIIDEGFDTDADSFTICNGDCDDTNALIYPGAPEILDLLDNNCDGQIDEGLSPDADGDGFTVADGDCDDNNASINPNATEICNGIDDNCNTQVDEGFDLDADTFTICNGDCDDTNALIYPGAPEVLDSLDNNCDGQIDEGFTPDPDADGDGFSLSEGDCNDADPNINPGATELCNGIDDNCNSIIDEGFDLDGDGETSCEGDCNDNDSLVNTSVIELCNSIDDNCDTFINEGLDCDEVTIQIPNGISPNGDGFNDAWHLPWLNGMTGYSIVISNRWGQVIFQTNDYITPWDGTYLGNSLPAADYFYVIKLSDNTIYEGVISIKY